MYSLSKKLLLLIVSVTVLISGMTILFSYQAYRQSVEERFIRIGQNMANTVAEMVDGALLERYLETGTTDAAYADVLSSIRTLQRANDIEYLYIVRPTEAGVMYLFDTDQSSGRFALGDIRPWPPEMLPYKDRLLNGQNIEAVVVEEKIGAVLSVLEPMFRPDGTVLAYVGADIPMSSLLLERQNFLGSLLVMTAVITLAFSLLFMRIIRRIVIRPINAMAEAASNFFITGRDDGGREPPYSLGDLPDIRTNDELQTLSEALHSMVEKIDEYFTGLRDATKKAETDQLTGLRNRAAFLHAVESFLEDDVGKPGQAHAFLMIDVDHFKEVNDTYGHSAGDEILQECALGLQRVFRAEDVVARLGGDEFAVFCKNVGSVEIVERKAESICSVFRSICLADYPCEISASVGISVMQATEEGEYFALYEQADKALYHAKDNGRDRYSIYEEGMREVGCALELLQML